jgi:glycosyltransferase involved in cell wall biosynthesis
MILGIDARIANTPVRLGVGVYGYELIRAITRLPGAPSLRLYLDAPPVADFPVTEAEAEIVVLPARRFWTQRALAKALRTDPPDVFLAPVSQMPLGAPCPVIATYHGWIKMPTEERRSLREVMHTRLIRWLALTRAARVLVVSEESKRAIEELPAARPERIAVTYHGVSEDFSPEMDAAALQRVREKYCLPARYLLFLGRLNPRKNLLRTITAFEELRAANPGMPHHFVLAGTPQGDHGETMRRIEASPVKAYIHAIGHVERGDVQALLVASDALVLVSHLESFGIPVAEAMACGTPVVTSNTTCMPEIVGDAGLCVDPLDVNAIRDAMATALLDKPARATLIARGLDRVKQFTWENTARQTVAIAREVLEEKGTGNVRTR